MRPNLAVVALTWVDKKRCNPLVNWVAAIVLHKSTVITILESLARLFSLNAFAECVA